MPRSGTSFQQRQCEGTGTSQNRAPPPQPSQPGAGAKSGKNMASLGLRKLPEECLRFGRPSAAHLAGQHDQPWLCRGHPRVQGTFALSDGGASSMPHRLPRHNECVASPSRLKGETNVVSSAIWAPLPGRPPGATATKSKSRTITFVVIRAPASRQTRAAAFSRANPRRPNTPPCAQAARWWPRTSRRRHTGRSARKGYGEPTMQADTVGCRC